MEKQSKQDSAGGVRLAPQSPFKGLEQNTTKYGRAYIPDFYAASQATRQTIVTSTPPFSITYDVQPQLPVPKGFVDSHSITNYGWIFDGTLKPGETGYINEK